MCNNVQNSAVIADIFMKFGTKVLNWTLNDSRNFYWKQTLDGEIIKFFRRGPVFFRTLYIYSVINKNGPPKKNLNNFITLKYFFLKFYSLVQRPILHISAKFYFNIARLDNFMPFQLQTPNFKLDDMKRYCKSKKVIL